MAYDLVLKKLSDKPNDKSAEQTEQDHCNNRKIKSEVFLFNSNVPGQATDPVQFIAKKINDNAHQDNDRSDSNDPFTGFAIHITKL